MSSEKAANEKIFIEFTASELVTFITNFQLLMADEEANPYYFESFEELYDMLHFAFETTLLHEELKLENKRWRKMLEKSNL